MFNLQLKQGLSDVWKPDKHCVRVFYEINHLVELSAGPLQQLPVFLTAERQVRVDRNGWAKVTVKTGSVCLSHSQSEVNTPTELVYLFWSLSVISCWGMSHCFLLIPQWLMTRWHTYPKTSYKTRTHKHVFSLKIGGEYFFRLGKKQFW